MIRVGVRLNSAERDCDFTLLHSTLIPLPTTTWWGISRFPNVKLNTRQVYSSSGLQRLAQKLEIYLFCITLMNIALNMEKLLERFMHYLNCVPYNEYFSVREIQSINAKQLTKIMTYAICKPVSDV